MNTGQKTLESMSTALWYNRWTLNKFSQYLTGDILEVGFGIGNFSESLMHYGNVWAIDIDETYLKKMKKQKVIAGFGDVESGEYFFKNKKFDAIVCLNVLEHIEKDKQALKNLFKLLKPEGHLILLVPENMTLFGEIDRAIGHFRRYQKALLRKDLRNTGFKIVLLRRLNFLGAIGWFISGRILKDRIVREDRIKFFNKVAPFILPVENFIEPPVGTSLLAIVKNPHEA